MLLAQYVPHVHRVSDFELYLEYSFRSDNMKHDTIT